MSPVSALHRYTACPVVVVVGWGRFMGGMGDTWLGWDVIRWDGMVCVGVCRGVCVSTGTPLALVSRGVWSFQPKEASKDDARTQRH